MTITQPTCAPSCKQERPPLSPCPFRAQNPSSALIFEGEFFCSLVRCRRLKQAAASSGTAFAFFFFFDNCVVIKKRKMQKKNGLCSHIEYICMIYEIPSTFREKITPKKVVKNEFHKKTYCIYFFMFFYALSSLCHT